MPENLRFSPSPEQLAQSPEEHSPGGNSGTSPLNNDTFEIPLKISQSGLAARRNLSIPPPLDLKKTPPVLLSLDSPESLESQDSPRPEPGEITPLGRGLKTPEQVIPDYDPESKQGLGKGVFGETFLVNGRQGPFVLKEMDVPALTERAYGLSDTSEKTIQKQANQMHVEMKAMDLVNGHPNVPHFLGSEQTEDYKLRIAMSQAPGTPADKAAFTENETKMLMTQLLETLNYCHSKGVAHLDVRPANMLWDTENKNMTLIDFGESRLFTPGGVPILDTHLSLGTEQYRNPYVTGNDVVKIDTYAAGRVCERILKREKKEISQEAQKFIDRCLEVREPIEKLLQDPWLKTLPTSD